jgi:putative FmdB family regulatory protein
MPVYEFKCKKCGEVFSITAHLEEKDKLAVCPKCGGKRVEQVFSTFTCAPPAKY